uniref:Uncharacterized protein n=1 Tax=Heterorhabditis bacteriophora TaxID=37862 RepID=A0A1I7WVA8_HETBA
MKQQTMTASKQLSEEIIHYISLQRLNNSKNTVLKLKLLERFYFTHFRKMQSIIHKKNGIISQMMNQNL